MPAKDVVALYSLISSHDIPIWLDGGWGVDVLLERQTRVHSDVDIVVISERFEGLTLPERVELVRKFLPSDISFDIIPLTPKELGGEMILRATEGGDLSKIKVVIYADPGIDKNVHEIKCIGKFGELYIKCINNPSPKNPKTSYIAALSVIKLLKELVIEKLLIGT